MGPKKEVVCPEISIQRSFSIPRVSPWESCIAKALGGWSRRPRGSGEMLSFLWGAAATREIRVVDVPPAPHPTSSLE